MTLHEWHGCYDGGWKGRIVEKAFLHPAKAAHGLLQRIFDELTAMGVQRGDTVIDPFGGVGTTGLIAAQRGLRFVGNELEPTFHALALQNFARLRTYCEATNTPLPVMTNGDSRKLRAVIGRTFSQGLGCFKTSEAYGRSDGQLGAMKGGDVSAIVSSPPYAEIAAGAGGLNTKPPQHEGQQGGRSASAASQDTDQRYGKSHGQLARLPRGDFWAAAKEIVSESFAVLRRGGISVWIVKSFVRKGQIVDFPGDWRTLCEHAGFETVKEVHAMLVEESTRGHLFDGQVTTTRERKSFYRRLHEKRSPATAINWETVYFMRRP